MNPIQSISSVFRNYINFSGRAQRSEYWWFALFSFVSQAILDWIPFIGWIYALALLLPSLAVTARRLHDTDRTAWWMLLYLVPVLGFIVLAIMFAALIGISAFDPWTATEAEWGILGVLLVVLFVIWLIVTVVSAIVLLIFLVMPGTPGPNRYGPNPLQPGADMGGYGYEDPGYPYTPPADAGMGTGTMPEPSGRRYCTQCGTQLPGESRFCVTCGASV